MMSKENKKNYIEEMKKNFSSHNSVMIAQYQGLNVNELDKLRKELREKGIIFKVTKNRITKIAIKDTPVKDLEKFYNGPTATALSSDAITTAKILTKFAKIELLRTRCHLGREPPRRTRPGRAATAHAFLAA